MNLYTKVYLDKLAGAKWDAVKNVTKSVSNSRPFKAALVRYLPSALLKQLPEEYRPTPETMNKVDTLAATTAGAIVPGKGSSTTAKAIGGAAGLGINQFGPSFGEAYTSLTNKIDANTKKVDANKPPVTPVVTTVVSPVKSFQELTDSFEKDQQAATKASESFDKSY